MKSWIKVAVIAALALSPLAIIGAVLGGDLIAAVAGERDSRSHGNEGDRREEMLVKLTADYVTRGQLVTTAMRDGTQLAPVAFLNAELERTGAKWRVESVDGMTAETFAIS